MQSLPAENISGRVRPRDQSFEGHSPLRQLPATSGDNTHKNQPQTKTTNNYYLQLLRGLALMVSNFQEAAME